MERVCEPQAGQGAIVKSILRNTSTAKVFGFELMPLNQTFLKRIDQFELLGEDFLKCDRKFDKIIANPPFSKNQDMDHIMKMWECLKPKGRIVSIASRHWLQSSNKKETAFRKFLEDNQAEIIEVDAGKFKESGTSIATVIIVLNK